MVQKGSSASFIDKFYANILNKSEISFKLGTEFI